ncbi:hypothetical protein [Pseudodonghicola xiamenensis]|uniref:Uncharacterized protein n=1 Tax=Pseudodonghicola xiamenensis TaxID=337702 RepID=A0A8J3H4N2_9RHOB|nr:hypothetical protein [Pseudodonghicola xiamenensis]GHG82070.1 hypothetical protein GCM10010961_06270 [Pseudodonghicola xiamenensis]
MNNREDLQTWVLDAVIESGGEASVLDVAKKIWTSHETELRCSGDLFFTWQYDMRWAAQKLRASGKLTLNGRKWSVMP